MIKFIHHLFIPHTGNNHRSKLLHNSSLFGIVILLLLSSIISILVNRSNPEILGLSYSMTDQDLLLLVNEKRIENGYEPLELNDELNSAARSKAMHMLENDYWAHFAPDSTSPWKFITDSGYDYVYAGENLAKGFLNAEDAVEAWMESPAHRDNILSSQYSDVGFAIVEGELQGEETLLIVEMFGRERNQFLADADVENINTGSSAGEVSSIDEADANQTAEVPLLGVGSIDNNLRSIQSSLYESKPLLDSIVSTKAVSLALISILLITLILDFFVVTKRKIPRNVGNNVDHIILLSVFVVFMFMYNLGYIL